MVTTRLRGADKEGAGGQLLQHNTERASPAKRQCMISTRTWKTWLTLNFSLWYNLLNMDALAWRQSRPSVQQSELAGTGYQSYRGSKSHLAPHSWYACTYTAEHRHLPAASWKPEGKLSTSAWNINWHAKLPIHMKWGTWEGTQLCQLQQPHSTARAAHHPWGIHGGLCIHLLWPPTPSSSSPRGAPPGCWCLLLYDQSHQFKQSLSRRSATLQTGEHGTGHLEKASHC